MSWWTHLYTERESTNMCIDYLCFFSLVSILNTQIQGAKLREALKSGSKDLVILVPSSRSGSPEESDPVIHRDIKNPRPRARLGASRKVKLPRTPSAFLTPPNIQKNNVYSCHKKYMDERLRKNRVPSATPRPRDKEEKYKTSTSLYVRDHAPAEQSESSEETKENGPMEEAEHSEETERINFHINGHQGPDTYVFGYDTGDGNNRQFRYEERHENGSVTGHYGYYDARGRLRQVHYSSHPSQESFALDDN